MQKVESNWTYSTSLSILSGSAGIWWCRWLVVARRIKRRSTFFIFVGNEIRTTAEYLWQMHALRMKCKESLNVLHENLAIDKCHSEIPLADYDNPSKAKINPTVDQPDLPCITDSGNALPSEEFSSHFLFDVDRTIIESTTSLRLSIVLVSLHQSVIAHWTPEQAQTCSAVFMRQVRQDFQQDGQFSHAFDLARTVAEIPVRRLLEGFSVLPRFGHTSTHPHPDIDLCVRPLRLYLCETAEFEATCAHT